jgi:integrase
LTEEQVRLLLTKAEKRQSLLLFRLAIDSGMRMGELLALEWTDLDLTAGTVQVKRSVRTDEKGGPRVKEVKTKAARRTIRLTPKTVEALKAHREKASSRLVFPANRKGPFDSPDRYLNKRNVQVSFKRALKRAGLPKFRFHDLRHTSATLLYKRTKNIQAVSKRLGHKDVMVTLRTYAHFMAEMEEEVVGAMTDLLNC